MNQQSPAKLGVNIDHVATLRQARGTEYPSPLEAAHLAIQAGADQITIHLREDRRHIQDNDVVQLKETCTVPLNLEMAATDEMIAIASQLKPDRVTLVPEKRRELTTEGGLDLGKKTRRLNKAVSDLQEQGIPVSLFIDPEQEQIRMAQDMKARAIELQTGTYAEARDPLKQAEERERLLIAARYGSGHGLFIAAGHGLHLDNIAEIATIQEIREFNIGHSIIARALIVGLAAAVREMKAAINDSSLHR
jgi:pyridoxine 5-phosphate synthase